MQKYFLPFFLMFSIFIFGQQKAKIEFIVFTKAIADTEFITIAGNISELGNWDASKVTLNKINDTTYSRSFELKVGDNVEFKITKGSWDKEALDSDGSVPQNTIFNIFSDTSIIIKISGWNDQFKRKSRGQITGTVEYIKNLQFNILPPRDLIIWLPPSYYTEPDKRYPVLYLHDGQNTFDPATSSFGYDWRFDEIADSLISIREIDELIMIGIYNTPFRSQEYAPGDTGTTYMNFVVNSVKPLIDSAYRTFPQRENTFVGGSSMGGLISFMLIWEHPEVFSKALCISPAFKIENLDYISIVKNYYDQKKPIKIYIDNGGVGLEEKLQPGIDEMIMTLKSKGFQIDQDLLWHKYEFAQHSERDWSKRVWRMLKFLFDKNLQ